MLMMDLSGFETFSCILARFIFVLGLCLHNGMTQVDKWDVDKLNMSEEGYV